MASATAVVSGIDHASRFARSAAVRRHPSGAVLDWLSEQARRHRFSVERVPFADLDGWGFDPVTGNLGHRSGRFFTVEGLHVVIGGDDPQEWHQPILNQPEAAILGILAKEFDGVLHFLLQAKMEPGNCNLLQLSPTVQATPSNYTRVHQGSRVPYVEHFLRADPAAVLVDVLQSELGAWFYRKSNRHMIVEATGDVPLRDGYRWLTLGEIGELLGHDNVVNMDSRTVLGCAPTAPDDGPPLHPDTELLSWFTGIRARRGLTAERVPLAGLPGWVRHESAIDRAGGPFRIVGVSVEAGTREVTSWSQPLLEPHGPGVNAFLIADVHGTRHVLVRAAVEGGLADEVELGPTVQAAPQGYGQQDHPPFLGHVLSADPARVRYSAILSEEGGRFLNATSRYLVVETDAFDAPPGYRWVTPTQLSGLVKHNHYVNIQARTLLACLNLVGSR